MQVDGALFSIGDPHISQGDGEISGTAIEVAESGELIRMFMQGKYPGSPKLSFPVVDVRDVATMHRLALETTQPGGGRYMGVSETAWFKDMMLPIRAGLRRAARKVPARELPNLLVKLIGLR